MNYRRTFAGKSRKLAQSLVLFLLFAGLTLQAQLMVEASPVVVNGKKSVVKLALKNNLASRIESARAAVFLLDANGSVVGQGTRWIIGGKKDRPPMEPHSTNMFNFVVSLTTAHPSTNLTATVKVTRLVLEHGQTVDPNREVIIKPIEE